MLTATLYSSHSHICLWFYISSQHYVVVVVVVVIIIIIVIIIIKGTRMYPKVFGLSR